MNTTFHGFVDKIVKQADGGQAEKDDLYEEIMDHLQESHGQFVKEGFNEKQAEQKAMAHFLDTSEIGRQVQQVIFPFRKGMLLILAVASAIYSFAISSIWLYLENDTNIVWFLISTTNSSFVYVYAIRPIIYLSHRPLLNIILFIHLFIYIFGSVLIFGLERPISIILALLSLFIIVLNIVLFSLTVASNKRSGKDHHPNNHEQKLAKQIKFLQTLNITAGMILACATLLSLWLLLAFSGELTLARSVIFLPFIIWFISYRLQNKLITKNRKQAAYVLAIIPTLFIIIILVFLIMLIFS